MARGEPAEEGRLGWGHPEAPAPCPGPPSAVDAPKGELSVSRNVGTLRLELSLRTDRLSGHGGPAVFLLV